MDEFELVVKSPSQIMEARKKKFEARSSVSEVKTKISLKTSQSTPSLALVGGLLHINKYPLYYRNFSTFNTR